MKVLKIILCILFAIGLYYYTNQYVNNNYLKSTPKFITYEITENGEINTLVFKDIYLNFFNIDEENNKIFIDTNNMSSYKLNKKDNLLWTYSLNDGFLKYVIPNDKTYLIAIDKESSPSIIEVDSSGNIIWESKNDFSTQLIKLHKNNNITFYDKKKHSFIEIDRNNDIKKELKNTFCLNVVEFSIKDNGGLKIDCRDKTVETDENYIIVKESSLEELNLNPENYKYNFNTGNYFLLNQHGNKLTIYTPSGSIIKQIESSNFKHIVGENVSSNGSYIIICSLQGETK